MTPDHASGSAFPPGTTTVTYTATDNLGASSTCSFDVTVTSSPTVNAVSDQTVCNGSSTTAVNFTGTATTYNWTGSVNTIGLASSGSGNIASFTATNAGTAPVTDVITVTPTKPGCANGPTTTFNITVNPTPDVNTVSDQAYCDGDFVIGGIPFTGSVSGTSFDWTSSNGSVGTGNSGNGDIPAFTAFDGGNTPVSSVVNVTPSYTNNGVTCTGSVMTFNITVNPNPDVDPVADQTVCNGNATTAVNFTGSVAGTVYNWTGSTGTIGLASSGSGNIASFTATNAGSAPVTDAINVNTAYTNAGLTCFGGTGSFDITVNPTPTVNGVSDQVVCNNGSTATVNFTGAVPGTSYDWTGTDGTIGIATSGNGDIASFTATNAGTTPVTDVITVTPSYTNNGVTCTGTPTSFSITVNPTPTVNPVSDQTVCNSSSTTTVSFTGAVAGTSYDWTGTNSTIGIATSGNGDIASFTATNAGTAPVTDVITVTPSYTNAGVTCTGTPTSFSITVNPTPTVNGVSDQVVCHNSPTTAVNFTGAVPGTSYDWTGTSGSIGISTSGNGNIASFNATNFSTTPITDVITVTPSYTNNGVTCTGTPTSFSITVNPRPLFDPPAGNFTVCNNSSTSVNFFTTVPGTVVSWTGTDATIGIPTSGTGNIPTFTATNAGTAPVIDTIYLATSYTNAGVTCSGEADTFTITVNPTPTVNGVADQVVCNNGSTTTVNFTGAVPGTSYDWTGTDGTIGIATSGNGDIASFTATNTGTTPVTDVITVTPSYTNNGVTCTGTPTSFSITVNPTPTVNAVADQFVCNNNPTTTVTFTGAVAGTVYDWTGTDGTIGIATSGTGDIASFTATNTGNIAVTDVITVTPSYTNAGVTCTGLPISFNITVNPTPIITPNADQEVCNGASTVAVPFSSTVVGTKYDWTSSNASVGLPTSATNVTSVPSFTAINTTTTDVIDTIVVVPTSPDFCVGPSDTFTITIHPTPVVNLGPNVTTCGGNVVLDAANPGSSFAWSNGVTTQLDTVSAGGLYKVIVTTIYGCIDSGSVNIYIKPTPSVNLGADASYCGGTVTLDAGNVGDIYSWSTGATTQQITVGSTNAYSVIVTDTASGCQGFDTINLTFNTLPVVNLGPDTTLCGGSLTLLAGDPLNTYQWSPSGSTSNSITVTTTGTYSVTVNYPSGCSAIGSIHVTVFTKPDLGPDFTDSICPGSTADLNSYFVASGLTLSYSTATPGAVDQGIYRVVGVNANGCSDTTFVTIIYRVKPDLGADKTDSVCPGYTYNLDNLYPNAGYTSYVWSGTFTETAVGPGTYTLVVTNASGCTDTAVATIINSQKPDLGGNKTDSICQHSTYDLTALYPLRGFTTYHWLNVPDSSAVAAGTYQLVVTNAQGCTDTAYATIIYRAQPVVTLSEPVGVCSTEPAFTLTGGSPAGGTYFINGVINSLFDPGLLASGPQSVVYVYTNGSGCTDSAVTTITVYPQPVIVDTVSFPPVCTNSQALDLNTYFSPAGGSFTGPGVTGQYFYPTLTSAGPTSITYIFTDQHGCMDTSVRNLTVLPQVNVTLHTSVSNMTICGGQEITFTAAGATQYQFFVNGVAVTSISDTNTYTTTTLQNHDEVTVVGSNGCSSMTSDFIIIDVNPAVIADAGRDTTIDLGQTVQLQGSATGGTGNLTYNWTPTIGLDLSNVPNPKYSGSDTTLFTLRVSDANGCWDTATVTVNVRIPENVLLPNILTPNGDGQNDAWILNAKINLAGSHLLIFNRWGEKVYEADSYANSWQGTYMNTNDKLPDGTYYYVLKVPAQNNHEYTGPINLLSTQK
ncbi:MAG: C-terminal target protein [Bacteroidetes bacterium]|nr:C-terminal target protein [Bacteroidota bacterium]